MASPRQRAVVVDLLSDDGDGDRAEARPTRLQGRQMHPPQANPAPPAPPALDDQANPDVGLDDYAALDIDIPDDFPYHEFVQPPDVRFNPQDNANGEYIWIDGEAVFIPNSPVRADPGVSDDLISAADQPVPVVEEPFTVDTCLQRVLVIFPDVSHDHVRGLYDDFDGMDGYEAFSGRSRFENIIDKLATAESYPKHDKGNRAQKRKREDEEEADAKTWDGPNRAAPSPYAKGTISAILKADFPEIPKKNIAGLLSDHKHLYQTYIAIATVKDTSQREWRGRASLTNLATADTIASGSGIPELNDELTAARKRVHTIRAQRASDEAQKRVEEENRRRAMEAGETAECQACFEDLPMNRQIHCNGDVAHFTCFDCATVYVKTQVGESRSRVLCTAGCGAGFARAQLHLLADKKLLERLEQLQQEQDIRDAGLDDLEECPFCDYKAIMPPVEENFEFRCENPGCEKVSCRRCKAISHIPLSCDEHAKDNKLNTRHQVEEAMTAAMIRACNKCKKQFIKDYGCNKMRCPSCGNTQCYVCSQNLSDYDHFEQAPGGRTVGGAQPKKCPLYDNVEERHEREVREAEAAARAKAMEENPGVSEQDLEIRVSDAVKKASQDRVKRAGAIPGGVPAALGGLFAAEPDVDPLLGDLGADVDEDGEHDEARPEAQRRRPQRRRPVPQAVRLAEMRNNMAALRRLGAGLGADHEARHNPARDLRLNALLAARQLPANPPALGPVAGVIPVYGVQPAWPAFPAAPQQPPPMPAAPTIDQGRGAGHRPGAREFRDAYHANPFGGGAVDPFAANRIVNNPLAPAMRPPSDPRLQALNGQGQDAGQAQQGNFLLARMLEQQLRDARAAHMALTQNIVRRAGQAGEVNNMPPGDFQHDHQDRNFPDGSRSG